MIVVTGATGKLGRHVIESLLKTTPAAEIVAAVRSPEKASDLAALGITLRQADYSQPATLLTAFAGADNLLLISGNELGQRIPQHKAVIDAARSAGIKLLAYTSLLRAGTSTLTLASEHLATEQYLQASGIPYVFLRNGWYLENHTEQLAPALAHGAILGAAGEGKFSAASRADYAAAAAAVLTTPGHENKTYELAGDTPYTLPELAAEVAKQSGKPVVYNNLPGPDLEKLYLSFGLPAPVAAMLVDSDLGAAKGELATTSTDLRTLIGRPTTTLAQAVAEALK
ncbi:SDR family oxidoreductase [Granulicella tundricola]|uniref:NmrA family protein n=1 Tax=Granulicella tundricola (strain ATCC BAA-1859 / DSM 23138 / MP5ACTX9) TaxID=1198114 RepID=E8WZ21_GRATM|nr:SDR family oxidoreductase [Granulicella tundricola]ADW69936.1 NmrA family protein [Granulicella tundricola MP5ACTX9]